MIYFFVYLANVKWKYCQWHTKKTDCKHEIEESDPRDNIVLTEESFLKEENKLLRQIIRVKDVIIIDKEVLYYGHYIINTSTNDVDKGYTCSQFGCLPNTVWASLHTCLS